MQQQLNSFEWEITEFQDKQKKSAYFIPQALYIGFILLFFIPGLAFIVFIFAAIMIANFSQLKISNGSRGNTVERYKIDQRGVEVENPQYSSKRSFAWTDLVSYYSYNKANPLAGSLLGNRVGDDFTVIDKNNNRIQLRAGSNDSERVGLMLSQKLKLKLPSKADYYSAGKSFQMAPIFGSGNRRSSANNLQGPVRKFGGGDEERRFYEQRRMQEQNFRKNKEKSTWKILIAVYLAMVSLSIIYYLATSISTNDGTEAEKILLEAQKKEPVSKDENYWYSRGWPKNDLNVVRCRSDIDCEYYFAYMTSDKAAIREKVNSNPNVMAISDSKNGCAWGLINKNYGFLWQERYPKPDNCVFNSALQKRKLCDALQNVCVIR